MGRVKNFKELIVWQKAIGLSVLVYKELAGFPKTEVFGLSSQIKRSVVSIASNIAEGNGRSKNTKEYHQYLRIALGSAQELETQLIISRELGFLDTRKYGEIESMLIEVEKMLAKMISIWS